MRIGFGDATNPELAAWRSKASDRAACGGFRSRVHACSSLLPLLDLSGAQRKHGLIWKDDDSSLKSRIESTRGEAFGGGKRT